MEQAQSTPVNTMINYILIFFTGLCDALSHSSAESIYNWAFRILSLISLTLLIIINYPKAKDVITNRKNKYKNDGNTKA